MERNGEKDKGKIIFTNDKDYYIDMYNPAGHYKYTKTSIPYYNGVP